MSDVLGTSTAAFCRGQDHPGGVPVASGGATLDVVKRYVENQRNA